MEHIHDLVTYYDEYLQALPEPPGYLVRLLEKREAGEILDEREEKILYAANRVNFSLIETRANEASLAAIFSKQGLREIADPKTLLWNIYYLINAMWLASRYNALLFYYLHKSNLSDSYSSELTIASKAAFYGVMVVTTMVLILEGLKKTAQQVVLPASKAAIKVVRKGLGQCSLAARSLLSG